MSTKRESAMAMELAARAQDINTLQEFTSDLFRLRSSDYDYSRAVYTDPAINAEFAMMKATVTALERKLKDKEEAGSATASAIAAGGPTSQIGGLLRQITMLKKENEKLREMDNVKVVTEAREAKLLAEAYGGDADLRKQLEEAHEYIGEMEEEREELYAQVRVLRKRLGLKPHEEVPPDDETEGGGPEEEGGGKEETDESEQARGEGEAGGGGADKTDEEGKHEEEEMQAQVKQQEEGKQLMEERVEEESKEDFDDTALVGDKEETDNEGLKEALEPEAETQAPPSPPKPAQAPARQKRKRGRAAQSEEIAEQALETSEAKDGQQPKEEVKQSGKRRKGKNG